MRKKIWLWNHYATDMYKNHGGRHYWFAENLIKQGYEATVFCANTYHNTTEYVDTGNKKYTTEILNNIPFVFIKTTTVLGNGLGRIKNMSLFYYNLFSVSKDYARLEGKPDVILASSVHPLTLIAGIQIAKKFGIPCICEVRDLWPESFVAYNIIKKGNPLLKLLYAGEKWIYKKSDKLIFTMEGGIDYIIDKEWDKKCGGPIDINKLYHINNGIDLEGFDKNKVIYTFKDEDLMNDSIFKVIYTGSIRLVNKVELILDVAKLIQDKSIKFLIWGNGDQLETLKRRVEQENIENVIFKGWIDKKFIPYITSRAQLNISFGETLPLYKFGISPNKMFDYFASSKPSLWTFKTNYSLIEKYNAGIELDSCNAEKIAEGILYFKSLDQKSYDEYCINARRAAEDYNFINLTKSLIDIIEE